MPSELVRQFTLLREVDAKYSGTTLHVCILIKELQNKISSEIDAFITSAPQLVPQQRGQQLFTITRLLTSALGCADEKVSVASSAADISDKHKLRLDADYEKLEQGEISELIRYGPPDHPAFVHGSTMGMSRSESRRLAIAQAKKNDEELADWRKEQIERRGQLLNDERVRSGAAKKKAALLAVAGQHGNTGISGGGKGTPPRGQTPIGGVGDVKKSHHKKRSPRNEENPPVKKKHPNQYTYESRLLILIVDMQMPIDELLLRHLMGKWMMMEWAI
jgi:Inhibitor of growth proteins N-terminal histone-binding